MFVHHRMSSPAITVDPSLPVMDALHLMEEKDVRRLPVVDGRGRLVGIVSEKDVLRASPSPATTLSIFEVSYLLHRLTVGDIMTREVVTVREDTPLEEAARIMAQRHLGGLPVMREGKLIGMITETDLLLGFSEVLGAFEPGVRITVELPDEPGAVAEVSNRVKEMGGNIAALSLFRGADPRHGYLVARVQGVGAQDLVDRLSDGRAVVVDVREFDEVEKREERTSGNA
ncbi:MAG: CBS domain-containing protein [Anaerolineae bacterium]|nr:CBS domain-containing protein [Anaerolineae bacterium]